MPQKSWYCCLWHLARHSWCMPWRETNGKISHIKLSSCTQISIIWLNVRGTQQNLFAYLSFLAVITVLRSCQFTTNRYVGAWVERHLMSFPVLRALFCLFLYNDVLGLWEQPGSFLIIVTQVTLQKEGRHLIHTRGMAKGACELSTKEEAFYQMWRS